MKTVKELYRQHRQEYRDQAQRQETEMGEAVRKEFPIGARVKYNHGQNFIEAVIESYPPFEWDKDKVIARNVKTGNKKEIEAWQLEHSA